MLNVDSLMNGQDLFDLSVGLNNTIGEFVKTHLEII